MSFFTAQTTLCFSRGFLWFLLLAALTAFIVVSVEAKEQTKSTSTTTTSTLPPLRRLFVQWKLRHHKSYATAEEDELRFQAFRDNFLYIRNHNRKTTSSFKLALNAFSDLTSQEFAKRMNGYDSTLAAPFFEGSRSVFTSDASLPASVDWRTQGVVTPVKNQGQCGGCWSFSATGAIEGQWALAGNPLVSLSEQNLLDCSTNGGNNGCNGGLMTAAFEYVISNGGIDTEASYSYQTQGPLQCRYSAASFGASIESYQTVTSMSEADLAMAVATYGPVSVAIDASHSSFQSYSSGVYYEPACSSTNLDHGVLVVGYGATAAGEQYWIVKNSWGTDWGIDGYIWMARNQDNNCGIATQASYPLANYSTSNGGGGDGGGTNSGYLFTGRVEYYSTGYPTTVGSYAGGESNRKKKNAVVDRAGR